MLAPDSIFRCMPTALQVTLRRLMGGLGYAFDGAEMYYGRVKSAARGFYVPGHTKEQRENSWTSELRLSVVLDTWSCVDSLNRCRQIVSRFPYGDPHPVFVDDYLAQMETVRLLRNRIQHLDEDYQSGKHFDLGHPVFGTVSWTDTRFPNGFLQFAISSGPIVEGGLMQRYAFKKNFTGTDCITDICLMAFDRTANLDELMQTTRSFITNFESLVKSSVVETLRRAAVSRGVPLEQAGRNAVCDMISAMAFYKNGNHWVLVTDESSAKVEIPLGSLDLGDEKGS